MSEERDIPTLDDLVNEIEALSQRLDRDYPPSTQVTAEAVMSELKNTLLPLIKDVASAAMIDISDLNDAVNPVKVSMVDAQEMADLLKAFAASRPTDLELQARIKDKVDILEGEDDEDGDDDEDTEQN